jgi:hypothetical protein
MVIVHLSKKLFALKKRCFMVPKLYVVDKGFLTFIHLELSKSHLT